MKTLYNTKLFFNRKTIISKNKICSLFVFSLCTAPLASHAAASCDLDSCQTISDYRETQIALSSPSSSEECTPFSQDTTEKISNLTQALNPNFGNPNFEQFYQCANEVSKEVQNRRQSDIQNISQEIQRLKTAQLPKEKQMEILRSLIGEDSFYNYFYNEYQESRKLGGKTATRLTYQGPALETASALNGGREEGGVFQQIYNQSGWSILDQKENPIEFLVQQMRSQDYSISPSPQNQNFTPGISRIILFEMIRSIHHNNSADSPNYMKDFNQFAQKMQLGLVLPESDFTPEETEEAERSKARFQYTINDGYFLSAKPQNMNPTPPLPMSFDCTSFVQFCSFGLDSFSQDPLSQNPLKIVTSDFLAAYKLQENPQAKLRLNSREETSISNINKAFNIEPFTCESQLQKGDMVVFRGHIFIFDGYETGAGGQIQMKTIEASGNQHRTLGSFNRDIYNGPPECSQFVWGRDDLLKEKNRAAYIVRFKPV